MSAQQTQRPDQALYGHAQQQQLQGGVPQAGMGAAAQQASTLQGYGQQGAAPVPYGHSAAVLVAPQQPQGYGVQRSEQPIGGQPPQVRAAAPCTACQHLHRTGGALASNPD